MYSAAFQCKKCPQNADEAKGPACPLWWEVVYTNIANGEVRIDKRCGFQQLPLMLIEVVKASYASTENVTVNTNLLGGVCGDLSTVTTALEEATGQLRHLNEAIRGGTEQASGLLEQGNGVHKLTDTAGPGCRPNGATESLRPVVHQQPDETGLG